MVAFSWKTWCDDCLNTLLLPRNRRPRRARLMSVETLEYRLVLTAPVANPASFNTPVDTPLTATLSGTDADGDPLIFHTVTTDVHGSLSLNSFSGEFTYTPSAGFTGTASFTFKVNDGTSDSPVATVDIIVGDGQSNSAPVANSKTVNTSVNVTLNGTLSGTDPDGDPLTFAVVSTATHGSLTIASNGGFTYIPDANFTGSDSFTFKVNDGTVDSPAATVNINVTGGQSNSAPTATSANTSTSLNTPLNGNLTGFDADGDSLSFSKVTDPSHGSVSVNASGAFTYVPDANFSGSDSFTFKVNDGALDSAPATVNIQVGSQSNSAPTATPSNLTTVVNTTFSGNLTGFDANNDPLSFSLVSDAAHGSVSVSSSGSFTYIPASGFTGGDSFTFKVNDGSVDSAPAAVNVTVTSASNSPPVANSASFTAHINTSISSTLTGSDVDGDPLSFATVTLPTHGNLVLNAGGGFTYTPDSGFAGTDSFMFRVNDGTVNSNAATVTINVSETSNTLPEANPATFNTAAGVAFNGSLTGNDADSDPLTFLAGTADPEHGSVVINTDGSFVYTPTAGFSGTDFFSFLVNDGTANSSEALVTMNVGATGNNPPVAIPQNVNVVINGTFNGTLVGTDVDGDSLTYAAGSVDALHGTVHINSNGSFSYKPNASFAGDDAFSFQVNDGTVDSAEALVTVHVGTSANTPPVVVNGSATAMDGVALNGSLSPLGSDNEHDPLIYSAVTQPTHGTLALSSDGTFVYIAHVGFTGNDSFTFQANDGSLDSNVASFMISVTSTAGHLFDLNLSSNPGSIATTKKSVVPLDSSASVINVDPSASFANATINATITDGSDPHDRLVVIDGSSAGGTLDVRGKKIRFNGSEVARFSGGRRGQPLQLTFNGSATEASVNAVLQHIGVRTSKNAGREARTILIQVSAGGASSSATIQATVTGE